MINVPPHRPKTSTRGLPKGAPPKVPYVIDGRLYENGRALFRPHGVIFGRVPGGWLEETEHSADKEWADLTITGDSGHRAKLASKVRWDPVLSPDRSRVIVIDDRDELRAIDLRTRAVIRRRTLPWPGIAVASMQNSVVVYGEDEGTWLWNPSTDRFVRATAWNRFPQAAHGTKRLLLEPPDDPAYGEPADCYTVIEVDGSRFGRPTLDVCGAWPRLSPSGRLIGQRHYIIDIATERILSKQRFGSDQDDGQGTWEDENHVLWLVPAASPEQAVVRCDVRNNKCELALPVTRDLYFQML